MWALLNKLPSGQLFLEIPSHQAVPLRWLPQWAPKLLPADREVHPCLQNCPQVPMEVVWSARPDPGEVEVNKKIVLPPTPEIDGCQPNLPWFLFYKAYNNQSCLFVPYKVPNIRKPLSKTFVTSLVSHAIIMSKITLMKLLNYESKGK